MVNPEGEKKEPGQDKVKPNFYEVLGVNRDATQKDIEKANQDLYDKIKRQQAAGEITEEEVVERIGELSEAFEVLRKPKKRKKYNKTLEPLPGDNSRASRQEPSKKSKVAQRVYKVADALAEKSDDGKIEKQLPVSTVPEAQADSGAAEAGGEKNMAEPKESNSINIYAGMSTLEKPAPQEDQEELSFKERFDSAGPSEKIQLVGENLESRIDQDRKYLDQINQFLQRDTFIGRKNVPELLKELANAEEYAESGIGYYQGVPMANQLQEAKEKIEARIRLLGKRLETLRELEGKEITGAINKRYKKILNLAGHVSEEEVEKDIENKRREMEEEAKLGEVSTGPEELPADKPTTSEAQPEAAEAEIEKPKADNLSERLKQIKKESGERAMKKEWQRIQRLMRGQRCYSFDANNKVGNYFRLKEVKDGKLVFEKTNKDGNSLGQVVKKASQINLRVWERVSEIPAEERLQALDPKTGKMEEVDMTGKAKDEKQKILSSLRFCEDKEGIKMYKFLTEKRELTNEEKISTVKKEAEDAYEGSPSVKKTKTTPKTPGERETDKRKRESEGISREEKFGNLLQEQRDINAQLVRNNLSKEERNKLKVGLRVNKAKIESAINEKQKEVTQERHNSERVEESPEDYLEEAKEMIEKLSKEKQRTTGDEHARIDKKINGITIKLNRAWYNPLRWLGKLNGLFKEEARNSSNDSGKLTLASGAGSAAFAGLAYGGWLLSPVLAAVPGIFAPVAGYLAYRYGVEWRKRKKDKVQAQSNLYGSAEKN